MKKIILLFAAMIFLVACNDLIEIEQPVPVETNGIMVSLSVTRHDSFGSTKATVKSVWADEDVIFVFFKGVAAPKYLEMKYDSSSDTWTPTAKNGLTSSDLSDAADKKMTAIYLPYGSTATVAASEGNFIFSDMTYSGYFLKAELVTYIYAGGVLSGTLNMTAPALSSGSDKLIHFDISGFTSGHNYKLYQDYVKPLTFTSVSADGILTINEGTMGASITGYEDGSMMSFSGILDASAVGNAVDYQFSIDDLTSSILYTRDAGTKTLSTSKYIGIGAINNTEVWNAFEYVDLGLGVKWATHNVGANEPEEYGGYYSWGEIEPKADYSWSTYKWCNGSQTDLTKYNTLTNYGTEDNKTILDPEDDVAQVNWGGSWRMPTKAELDELINGNNCTWKYYGNGNAEFGGIEGFKVTSKIEGYTDSFIFLPGFRYWSSSLYEADEAWATFYNSTDYSNRKSGYPVRPVFKSREWLSSLSSIHFVEDNKTMLLDASALLNVVVCRNGEVMDNTSVAFTWSSDAPSVVVVDEKGMVTAKSTGTAHITASIQSLSAQCTVTVTENELSIEHEYVDLGLSVKWATVNVGAAKPEDYGAYYAWGEIEPKDNYWWSNYKWHASVDSLYAIKFSKYISNSDYGTIDDRVTLDSEDDVAHIKWGGSWRMPTKEELNELHNNCTWTWYNSGNSEFGGVAGYKVISNIGGYTDRFIFLPCAGVYHNYGTLNTGVDYYGYYWSSTLSDDAGSMCVWFRKSGVSEDDYCARYHGRSVRPVCP